MQKIKELLHSPHIQIALATGASILILAYFSKRVLPQPIGYLPLAVPPFIATLYEALLQKYGRTGRLKTWYCITAILLATAIVIVSYMF